MHKRRLNTTISQKHWEILNKNVQKCGTQSKVLEAALEALETGEARLSREDLLWTRMGRELKSLIAILHKDLFLELIRTADFERFMEIVTKLKLSEYQVAWYYQKPLKECSLKEVVDGIILTSKVGNWLDSINCTDEGEYYSLKVTHSGGSENYSRIFKIFFENLFRAYGARTESEISDYSLFMKVFKK